MIAIGAAGAMQAPEESKPATRKTLKDVMPRELVEWDNTPAYKLRDVEVKAEHNLCSKKWPGPQKHVYNWCELVNGKAVGWNENPSRGWSFPVVTLK